MTSGRRLRELISERLKSRAAAVAGWRTLSRVRAVLRCLRVAIYNQLDALHLAVGADDLHLVQTGNVVVM